MLLCKYCNSDKYQKILSLRNHERCCKNNPSKINAGTPFRAGNVPWNKGLTKETDERVYKQAESLKLGGKTLGIGSTPEKEILPKKKIKEKAYNNGGIRAGSGRGKSGWYKGFYCRSSWELAFVIYHLDHNNEIYICNQVRHYEWNGKVRKYYPDFVLDGQVIEIKGYVTEQWEQKHFNNPDIMLITYKDLKDILLYVIKVYGKNFVDLYK